MRYIDADKLIEFANNTKDKTIDANDIARFPIADVVEADKAQKEIDYWHDKAQSYEQTILKLSLNKADVVEVVRCKDCRYWDNYNDVMVCMLSGGIKGTGDYCSYGERAEEYIEWHLEHKSLGFYDPIAELYETMNETGDTNEQIH